MGHNKKHKSIPIWAYDDNPLSTFGMIYTDQLKSKKFWGTLSCSSRLFYLVCVAHSSTKECKECLYNALKERYELLGTPLNECDLNTRVYDNHKKMFVFPKKHYEEYGYTKAYAYKCFKELEEKGFIKKVQEGKRNRKVNIYEFSKEWKM